MHLKMRKKLAASIALAGTALALVPATVHAEAFDGAYVGIEAGLGILDSKGSTIAGPFKDSDESAVVTGIVGFRMPLGASPVVVGAEADAGIYTDGGDGRYGVSGIGGVRLGESGLIYGRVGYGWRDGLPGDTGEGVVLGGGAEVNLTGKISMRADYKHRDYGRINLPDNTVEFEGHEITTSLLYNF